MTDIRNSPPADWIASIRARFPTERTVDSALTRKLEQRTCPSEDWTRERDVATGLRELISRHTQDPFTIRGLRPLSGGASKEQYVFELDWTYHGERRTGERMVLARDPVESIVTTERTREFQLLKAVKSDIPVPPPYWEDGAGAHLGRPSIVCGFVEGVQKPPTGTSNVTGIGVQFDAEHRAALGPQFIDYLARIHTLDVQGADLSSFDIPSVGTTEDIDRQINWWARVWEEDRLEAVPLMNLAEQWLRRNRKPLDFVSLVHGDYRTGNFLFDPVSKRITTILDWELGFFGDRHFDLAWATMPLFCTPDESGAPLCSSLYALDDFLRNYERASGMPIDEERFEYYRIFAHWRAIAMTLGAGLRAADGSKTHQDVVLAWFGGVSYPFLESLRQILENVHCVSSVNGQPEEDSVKIDSMLPKT